MGDLLLVDASLCLPLEETLVGEGYILWILLFKFRFLNIKEDLPAVCIKYFYS